MIYYSTRIQIDTDSAESNNNKRYDESNSDKKTKRLSVHFTVLTFRM